jgi:hypothetical protein
MLHDVAMNMPPMAEGPGRTGWLVWLVRIGGLRDGLLVLASLLYGLGYLAWSLHAWQNDLGLLPALDVQYFVAGVFPALILAAAFWAFRLITRAIEPFLSWLYSEPRTRAKTFAHRSTGGLLFVSGTVLVLVTVSPGLGRRIGEGWVLAAILGAGSLGSILYDRGATDVNSRAGRFFRLFHLGNVILLGALVAAFVFMRSVYPFIPQELGGVQPRCAYLDVARSRLSPSTLAVLVEGGELGGSAPVLRSKPLEIPYASSAVVMVRLQNRVYVLDRGAVEVITSCYERRYREP